MKKKKVVGKVEEKRVCVIVRLRGVHDIERTVSGTLRQLHLTRRNACTIKNVSIGVLNKVRAYVAYGTPSIALATKLLSARGKVGSKKADEKELGIKFEDIAKELLSGEKSLQDFGLKPVFRLNSPKKGLNSVKQFYPKGDLGDHKDAIEKLVERMI